MTDFGDHFGDWQLNYTNFYQNCPSNSTCFVADQKDKLLWRYVSIYHFDDIELTYSVNTSGLTTGKCQVWCIMNHENDGSGINLKMWTLIDESNDTKTSTRTSLIDDSTSDTLGILFYNSDASGSCYINYVSLSGITWLELTLGKVVLIYGVVVGVILLLIFCYILYRRHDSDQKTSNDWDKIIDLNSVRSNFRSADAIRSYIFEQSVTLRMCISLLFLVAKICINIYTNTKGFYYYYDKNLSPDFFTISYFFFDEGATIFVSLFEFLLTIMIVVYAVAYLLMGDHFHKSIHTTTSTLPNISAMVYFSFLNPKMAKGMLCQMVEKEKSNCIKNCSLLMGSIMLVFMLLVGLWVFVAKVNQFAYIYSDDRELDDLGFADFLLVFGIARQFASLYSMGDDDNIWNYTFITVDTDQMKQIKKELKSSARYDMNRLVCNAAIAHRPIFGYCWCCFVFGDLENVKRLYLEPTQDLPPTFYDTFRNIVPIGSISNYGDVAAAPA
eukprot:CAMPEP_0202698076 /NCGR_PEP_ID=MMETSP1385-20130828/11343_1 /ASSEMBLY_ACC=CAM_ASM_000861 /TAXON_ID=933848 /ORGANISM="Elphidium margaritaceum" /LENGTH=497 /DNA_ID=CAMNT_0049354679 /DNA_START=237 /DNA_END=1727 /DNA_ORIENTATION=+